ACAQHQLIDHARLTDALQALLRTGHVTGERSLVLVGFDQLDPQQRDLLDALRAGGIAVTVSAAPQPRAAAQVLQEPSLEQEVRPAALWARSRLTANRAARIGVVVPDLPRQRAMILRTFDEVLVPAALLRPGENVPRPWNVSLGSALADWPLIHAALLILELACGEMNLERASVLSRSPFIGGAISEAGGRALSDGRPPRLGAPQYVLG